MTQSKHVLAPMVRRLAKWSTLDREDRQAVLDLPFERRRIARGHYVKRAGDEPAQAQLLVSGFACSQKVVGDGRRQILSVHIEGDVIDLQSAVLRMSDHNVEALTEVEVAQVPREALRQLAAERPAVGLAMWHDTLVDAAIEREWLANLGQRTARVRLCHLLCEFGVRLRTVGQGTLNRYELPMTQEDLGDATGLTAVHVNRTLKGISGEGLVAKRGHSVFIDDWERLVGAGDFSPHYLYLQDDRRPAGEQTARAARQLEPAGARAAG